MFNNKNNLLKEYEKLIDFLFKDYEKYTDNQKEKTNIYRITIK